MRLLVVVVLIMEVLNLLGFGEAIAEAFTSEGEFSKLVANHFFSNVYRQVVFSIVHKELETYKGREDGAATSYRERETENH